MCDCVKCTSNDSVSIPRKGIQLRGTILAEKSSRDAIYMSTHIKVQEVFMTCAHLQNETLRKSHIIYP